MKRFLFAVTLVAMAVAPCAALSKSAAMPLSMIGVGPRGYDFLIGTWLCTSSVASPMGGPRRTTVVFTRSTDGSALSVRATGNIGQS